MGLPKSAYGGIAISASPRLHLSALEALLSVPVRNRFTSAILARCQGAELAARSSAEKFLFALSKVGSPAPFGMPPTNACNDHRKRFLAG